jgi:hypothetical protein
MLHMSEPFTKIDCSSVDDGSGIVAVHHVYQQQASTPARKAIPSSIRHTDKGKTRQLDDVICGIPEEYLLPPPPPPTPGKVAAAKGHVRKSVGKAINVADYFQIGDLVSVVGRMDLWINREERIVTVDRVYSILKQPMIERDHAESYIEWVEDANEEPNHLRLALYLSATAYSEPFELPEPTQTQESLPLGYSC